MEGCLYRLFKFILPPFESESILDCDNRLHIQALQYVYTPRINESLLKFQQGWNHHPLRTENNSSPIQLWVSGMLAHHYSQHSAVQETFSRTCVTAYPDTSDDLDTSGDVTSDEDSDHDTIGNGSDHEINPQSTASTSDNDSALSGTPNTSDDGILNPLQPSLIWGVDIYVSTLEVLLDSTAN